MCPRMATARKSIRFRDFVRTLRRRLDNYIRAPCWLFNLLLTQGCQLHHEWNHSLEIKFLALVILCSSLELEIFPAQYTEWLLFLSADGLCSVTAHIFLFPPTQLPSLTLSLCLHFLCNNYSFIHQPTSSKSLINKATTGASGRAV